VAVDSSGNAYVVGTTGSRDFPTTPGAFQRAFGGANADGFVVKVNADGSALAYASYFGGVGEDEVHGVAVDSDGNASIVGAAGWEIPTTAGAFDTTFNGGTADAFVVKVNPSLSTPTATSTSTNTPSATATMTVTPSTTATMTPAPSPTVTTTLTPSATATSTRAPTQTPTATPTHAEASSAPPPADDAVRPRKQTEQTRQQQQHTNTSNLDQYRTEGNVAAVATSIDGEMLLVTVALGRGELLALEIRCPGAICPEIRPGDYLNADGEQGGREEQGHFLVENLTITRGGHRVR